MVAFVRVGATKASPTTPLAVVSLNDRAGSFFIGAEDDWYVTTAELIGVFFSVMLVEITTLLAEPVHVPLAYVPTADSNFAGTLAVSSTFVMTLPSGTLKVISAPL